MSVRPAPNEELGYYDGPPPEEWEDAAPAALHVVKEQPPATDYTRRLRDGGSFILDAPTQPPAVWGDGSSVLWAQGEPLMVCAPSGVGKTTIAGQLVRGRLGLSHELLGYPIAPDERRVLYLAMDRPNQIRRSMKRQFTDDERDVLAERLTFWPGPPIADIGRHPGELLNLAVAVGAGTVVIDSMKDAAVKLTDDETGSNVNRAIQEVIAHGIEVLVLHHQKKGQNGSKPNTLEDVYGSTWLTAGMGSVVLLWGTGGDPLVELRHLKQPADEIGPLTIEHHLDGTSSVYRGFDLMGYLTLRGEQGATVAEVARAMFEKDPNDTERKKAQRRLDRLVADGKAARDAALLGGAGGSKGARYRLVEQAP